MKVAIYSRVSTKDKGHDTENQIIHLRNYCDAKGYELVHIYEGYESGSIGRKERAEFDKMFRDARRKKFSMLLFWSIDRFSREGVFKTMMYLKQLDEYGIKFHSYTEEYLTTDNELVSNILLTVMSYFANLDREKISERTKAGLERARLSKGHLIPQMVQKYSHPRFSK